MYVKFSMCIVIYGWQCILDIQVLSLIFLCSRKEEISHTPHHSDRLYRERTWG